MIRTKSVYAIRNKETGSFYNKNGKFSDFTEGFTTYETLEQASSSLKDSKLIKTASSPDAWEIIEVGIFAGPKKQVEKALETLPTKLKNIKHAVADYLDNIDFNTFFTPQDVLNYLKVNYDKKQPSDGTVTRYLRLRKAEVGDVVLVGNAKDHTYQKIDWLC